jgi:hypothetical protein
VQEYTEAVNRSIQDSVIEEKPDNEKHRQVLEAKYTELKDTLKSNNRAFYTFIAITLILPIVALVIASQRVFE